MTAPALTHPPRMDDYIVSDPHRLGGEPVFKGTRVPIRTLFQYLRKGIPVDQFLSDFEGVTHQQALAVLELAESGIIERTRRP